MTIDKFKVTIYTTKNLNETELENLCQDLDEIEIKDKVYGMIRELLRERINSNFGIDVEVE